MKFAKPLLLTSLPGLLLLLAVVSPGFAGTILAGSDPEPTTTPLTADWVDFVDGSRLFALRHPHDWVVNKSEVITLSPSKITDEGFSVLPDAPVLAVIPQSLFPVELSTSRDWVDALRANWDDTVIEIEPGSLIADRPADIAHVAGTDRRTAIAFEMNLITMPMTDDKGLIIAVAPQSLWDETWPVMQTILDTMKLLKAEDVNTVVSATQVPALIWQDLKLGKEEGQYQLSNPQAIAVSPNGELYVLDGDTNQIQIYSPQGIGLSQGGQADEESSQFDFNPRGELTIDMEGNVYVVDTGNARIQKLDPRGNVQLIGENELSAPRDIAVSPSGVIFVTDAETRKIHVFDKQGKATRQISLKTEDGTNSMPEGIDIGPEGKIYVTTPAAQSILILDSTGQIQSTIGRHSSEASAVAWPVDVEVDSNGDIYVADPELGQVKQFSPHGEVLATFNEVEIGESIRPSSLALGMNGNLFITDEDGKRVLYLPLQGEEISNLQLTNGNFEYGLAGWKPLTPQTQAMDDKQVIVYDTGGPQGQTLELIKLDDSGESGTVGVLQPLDLSVGDLPSLYLTAKVMIIAEEGENIGRPDKEKPIEGAVLFRLFYKGSDGQSGEWYHGFYSQNVPDSDTVHFTTIPLDTWHPYRSENLLEELPQIDTITGLQIYGTGQAFQSQIDDVQLRTE